MNFSQICVSFYPCHLKLTHTCPERSEESQTFRKQILFRREVTVGHLLLDIDTPTQVLAKVNPPIRTREDVEFLWEKVLNREIDWIVSDHACCCSEIKYNADHPDDIWMSKSGFGGTEYLLSGVFSEGNKRGMSYNHMAEMLSWNPTQTNFSMRQFGL